MEGFPTWFKRCRQCLCLPVISVCLSLNFRVGAVPVDFESQGSSSPTAFTGNSSGSASVSMVVDGITVTFSGGALLSRVSDLPADESAVYGTASYIGAMSNPLKITFSAPVDDLVFSLYNGQTVSTIYQASDDGVVQQFALAPNLFKGATQISFVGTGSEVDISDVSGKGTWDFFIDNLQFDPAANPINVPDGGATFGLLTLSLGALGVARMNFGQRRPAMKAC
jgi:hypothetical protein